MMEVVSTGEEKAVSTGMGFSATGARRRREEGRGERNHVTYMKKALWLQLGARLWMCGNEHLGTCWCVEGETLHLRRVFGWVRIQLDYIKEPCDRKGEIECPNKTKSKDVGPRPCGVQNS